LFDHLVDLVAVARHLGDEPQQQQFRVRQDLHILVLEFSRRWVNAARELRYVAPASYRKQTWPETLPSIDGLSASAAPSTELGGTCVACIIDTTGSRLPEEAFF
jgi:hypothetical protein